MTRPTGSYFFIAFLVEAMLLILVPPIPDLLQVVHVVLELRDTRKIITFGLLDGHLGKELHVPFGPKLQHFFPNHIYLLMFASSLQKLLTVDRPHILTLTLGAPLHIQILGQKRAIFPPRRLKVGMQILKERLIALHRS